MIKRTSRTSSDRVLALAFLAVFLCLTACNIPEGSGFTIGVPHVEQEEFNYCVPASILMWRLYDGLPSIPQRNIFDFLGGTPCTALGVPAGVSQFTRTTDSYADVIVPSDQTVQEIVTRQITSVGESRVPVIAIVGGKNHVGVVNGGKYHDEGFDHVWDFVYFQDPASPLSNSLYSASDWLDFFCRPFDSHCAQIVSASAIVGWDSALRNFRDRVILYGEGGPAILNQEQ